jgi:predicted AAA+ superfamily ATPase
MHVNPFTLKEIPDGSAFCDRKKELKDLTGFASAGENVLLYSPRRYGKTSLVGKLQGHLESEGAITCGKSVIGWSLRRLNSIQHSAS